jgi:hypothetical protein
MIIVFPALTSSTVPSHVLPGICKALEKYLIVYRLDEIMEQAKRELRSKERYVQAKGAIVKTGAAAAGAASYKHESFIIEQEEEENGNEGESSKGKGKTEERSKGKGKTEVSVSTPKMDQAISLEPTWIVVSMGKMSSVLGVKVIAFPVKSDEKLANLILNDRVRYGLEKTLRSVSLWTFKKLLSVFRRYFKRDVGGAPTGDPTKDVILSLSQHGENIFVIMNFIDIPGAEFFGSAHGIKKLFKLGWGSFVITDNVDKKAIFCMKEFKGLCSSISYSNIYASLGKEQAQVYKDAEEVKASASPFFSLSTNIRHLASESVVNDKLERYLMEL